MVNKEYSHEDLLKIILKKARLIHTQKIEWAFTINCIGELFKCKSGTNDDVYIPSDKLETAIIILHNHPHEFNEPSSFSGIDVFNLLYYKPKEMVLCSYGWYFRISDLGCKKLPSEVKRELDSAYKKLSNKLSKKYSEVVFHNNSEIKSNYKLFKICLERKFRVYLKMYAKANNLLYLEGKL